MREYKRKLARRRRDKQDESMGRMSSDTRARVVWMRRAGFSIMTIRERLLEEGIKVSRKSLHFLVKKYEQTHSIADRKRAPRKRQLSNEHFQFIDEAMEANNDISTNLCHGD